MIKNVATAIAGLFLCVATLSAHHPFSAQYDWKKPVTLTGNVTKLNWVNPHVELTIDAKDDAGLSGTWTVELGSPAALQKSGLTSAVLKMGEKVTVDGWAAKDGSKRANAKSVTLSDGRELFAASSFFDTAMKPVATSGSSGSKR